MWIVSWYCIRHEIHFISECVLSEAYFLSNYPPEHTWIPRAQQKKSMSMETFWSAQINRIPDEGCRQVLTFQKAPINPPPHPYLWHINCILMKGVLDIGSNSTSAVTFRNKQGYQIWNFISNQLELRLKCWNSCRAEGEYHVFFNILLFLLNDSHRLASE